MAEVTGGPRLARAGRTGSGRLARPGSGHGYRSSYVAGHISVIMLAPWLCGERAVDLGRAVKADLAGPHKIRFELCVDHTIVR